MKISIFNEETSAISEPGWHMASWRGAGAVSNVAAMSLAQPLSISISQRMSANGNNGLFNININNGNVRMCVSAIRESNGNAADNGLYQPG